MSSPADNNNSSFDFQKHEKSQQICLKTPVKASCIFDANFNAFCLHFGSQNPSNKTESPRHFFDIFPKTRPRCPQDAPRRLQDTSKTPLRPSKKPPRRCSDAPRRRQDASGQPKDTSKLPQVALKHPKNTTKLKVLKNP